MTVQQLNFSNNDLHILPDGFFANVSSTAWLIDLYNNDMTYIQDNAFSHVTYLDTVLIGGNKLNYSGLAPVFNIPTLKFLDIKCGDLTTLPVDVFEGTPMANSLTKLDLRLPFL